ITDPKTPPPARSPGGIPESFLPSPLATRTGVGGKRDRFLTHARRYSPPLSLHRKACVRGRCYPGSSPKRWHPTTSNIFFRVRAGGRKKAPKPPKNRPFYRFYGVSRGVRCA